MHTCTAADLVMFGRMHRWPSLIHHTLSGGIYISHTGDMIRRNTAVSWGKLIFSHWSLECKDDIVSFPFRTETENKPNPHPLQSRLKPHKLSTGSDICVHMISFKMIPNGNDQQEMKSKWLVCVCLCLLVFACVCLCVCVCTSFSLICLSSSSAAVRGRGAACEVRYFLYPLRFKSSWGPKNRTTTHHTSI